MGSVTACFARVAKTLSPEDREAILKPIRNEITGRISAASKADPNADANAVALEVLDGMLSGATAPSPADGASATPKKKPRGNQEVQSVPDAGDVGARSQAGQDAAPPPGDGRQRQGGQDDAQAQDGLKAKPRTLREAQERRAAATHQDPGEKPEAATPAVVAESLQKAAKREQVSPKQMLADALRVIDEAIARAPDNKDEEKDAPLKATINVPGDGTFKVINTKERLREFRALVERSPGFTGKNAKPRVEKAVTSGDLSPNALAREMLADGEWLNAMEVLDAAGKPMMFGNGTDGEPIPYTDVQPIEIAGFKFFSGHAYSAKKEREAPWRVVHVKSGLAAGWGTTRADAVEQATKAMKEEKARAKVASYDTGNDSQGKPFPTQDELREAFSKKAQARQESTFAEQDRLAAIQAEMNRKERERQALYEEIMGAGQQLSSFRTAASSNEGLIRGFLNAAEKQGRAADGIKLLDDVFPESNVWARKIISDWEKASTKNALEVGYNTVKTGAPPYTMTWDEIEPSITAQVYVTRNARGEKNYRQWQEAHFEAVKEAVARGWRVPDKVLYDYPTALRSDLSDDDKDLASDAMVTTYQQTKDYGKAVQAYRDWKPGVDLKGFERTQKTRDGFVIEDGDITILVSKTKTWDGKERFQARLKNSTTSSSPNLTEQQAIDWADVLRQDVRKAAPAPSPAPAAQPKEPAHFAELRERAAAYWDGTVVPAVREYLNAYDAMGAAMMERNRIKPEGMSAREWLESWQRRKSEWDGSRKTQTTGIQGLSQKDLWPTTDGRGERLRKAMLAAIKALNGAPMTNSEMMDRAFGLEAEAASQSNPPAPRSVQDLIRAYQQADEAQERLGKARAPLDQLGPAVDAATKARDALAERLSEEPDEAFGLTAKTSDGRPLILTPSPQKKGQYQLTRFGSDGEPWGDSQYTSKSKAVDDFIREADLSTLRVGAEGREVSQQETANDRDTFTLERLNRGTNEMEPVTFKRGEYVRASLLGSDGSSFGEIDGISHARREFSVDGLWHPFGAAYKAERPAEPKKPTVPLSSVVDAVNAKYSKGLGPADAVSSMEAFKGVMNALYDGTASLDDYRAGYKRVRDAEAVKAELGKMTKDDLINTFGIMARPGETKSGLIDSAYKSMLRGFALGKEYGPNGYMMTRGGLEAYEKQKAEALDAIVEATTAEDLAKYADQMKAQREERAARRAQAMEALKDPKTIPEFRAFIEYHIRDGKTNREARMLLTPEQRALMDDLWATSTRGSRKERTDEQRTQVRVAGQTVDGQIIATKHTRKGHDLFVVRLAERVSREDYETLNAGAKKIGGYYSSFRGNGAIPGFQFNTREQAEAFVKLAGGDNADAQAAAQERRDAYADDRSQTAAERLTEMADRMDEAADESMGRERKANTERRARFAAAAEAGAREAKAMAKTMRNVAEALTAGTVKFLDRVRTKTQVELLQTYVANAKSDELRAKYDSYAEQEKRRGPPPTQETADYAEFPQYTAYRSDLASLGRRLLEVDGTKKLGERLMKVADDVSDAFTAFAKEPGNLFKLSTFSVRAGDEVRTAIFKDRETAERAIKRSGLSGKAIVFPEKRGVNRIIMSPSEAMARGIWKGDGDKRITLSDEFGAELVEGIGRAAKRGSKVNDRLNAPWQFERAYERRKQLSRMGLETPAEFRAALREFIGLREQAAEADKIKAMERAMIGRRNDGLDFFPTPESVADEMVAAADIQPEMSVLEPSAGMGHIADRIRAAGAEPDVIEMAVDRRELLQEKGYHLMPYSDFLQMEPRGFYTFGDVMRAPDGTEGVMHGGGMGRASLHELNADGTEGKMLGWFDRAELVGVRHRGGDSGYDRIVMNPPFSDGRDIQHVRHAYSLLKPGGRLVALMSESAFTNQNKRATEFREWLESVGGTEEKLPEGSFMDPSLPVNTGANARMVVIEKADGDVNLSLGEQAPNLRVDATELAPDTAQAYATASDADQRAVRRLQTSMARYIPGLRLDAVAAAGGREAGQPLQGADRARVAAAELLRALTGRRAVFFRSSGGPVVNGVHSSLAPDVLFLRHDATRPHMAVLGHEFLHGLRQDRPDLYDVLRDRMRLVSTRKHEPGADLQEKRRKLGLAPLSADALEEEFLADVMGDSWMDASFWKSLAGKEPNTLLRRAFTAAMRFVDDVLRKIADLNPFGTNAYLSDIKAARAAMAQALRDYVEVESVGAPAVDLNFSAGGDAPWYSALAREIGAARMNVAGPAAWQQIINGMVKAGKVKADEVEWSGVREWLGLQQGKVTREAVSGYLRENGVRVQEKVLGGLSQDESTAMERRRLEGLSDDALAAEYFELNERDPYEDFGDDWRPEAVSSLLESTIDRDESDGNVGGTKYANYTLSGGTNYREVLLTLPTGGPSTINAMSDAELRALILRNDQNADVDGVARADLLQMISSMELSSGDLAKLTGKNAAQYKSRHWDQPNVLAHIRLNDRTDADGRRVLFVEEIQSDWGQAAKKDGFAKPLDASDLDAYQQADNSWNINRISDRSFVTNVRGFAGDPEGAIAEAARRMGGQTGGVPRAPFVDKTDKWVALAIKRIVKMAVDEGYDRVAFVTGEQSAERYDLSKQVKSIGWIDDKMAGGRIVTIKPEGGRDIDLRVADDGSVSGKNFAAGAGGDFAGKHLSDVIGKDLAEKVMATKSGTLRGLDLKVGGEGMRAFYDKIVPSVLKDVLRKVGGAGLKTVELQIPGAQPGQRDAATGAVIGPAGVAGQNLDAPGFDITPAMRERAAGGMPMFSMAQLQAQTDTPEFKRWFAGSAVVDAQGRPLVVYHGTRGDFTAFDGGRVKARFPNSEGFYFASSPRQASVYADSINNAAENFDPASRFIKPVAEGANVMPAYVSLQNPKFINVSEWGTLESAVDGDGGARVRAAKAAGHDGVIVERKAGDEYDGKLVIAFRPEQIKSATGNRGTFDPGEADINFSIAVDTLQSNDTARRLSERVIDVLRSDSTIGLLGRTVGTPYHLAHAKRADGSLRNPDLRKVYDEAQDYLNDINTFANDPAELAPGVVPMLNKWSDARRPLRLAGEQRAKLARALFEGTLGWTRDDQGNAVQTDDPHKGIEWTGTELRQRFGFNDADVKLYQQTRAAIGRSLDLMAGAEVARQMGGRDLPEGLRAMVSRGDTGRFKGLVLGFLTQQVDAAESAVRTLKAEHREQLARFAEATPGPDTDAMRDALKARQAAALEQAEAKLGKWKSLQAGVQKTYERVEDLKDRGYMPLMRFGPHTVTVRDIDTKEVVFFGMYETQAEANVEARKLRETAEPNEAVSRGEMSQEQWRLFKGMSPETVELFGQVAGIERTPVFEEYIRRTKANHSALKRLIQRKGTPGFSEDVQRVLAAFLTSNARAAAANLHAGAMEEATLDIDQERGLVKDYATKLTQYVQNPTDEAQWLRGLMFTQFIGGSVASAMVNMTQPFTMTLPWLSQHSGPVGAARLLTAGMRSALTRIAPDSDLGKAMARAEKDGIVSPQALHELQGQAVNRFGRTESALRAMGVSTKAAEVIDASLRRALFAWGGFFSLAEQFNRRATFIAAYQLAQEKGMADAFAFAEEAVTETQGQYSRANRPQWARGPVMSTVFTFKQFSIAYIEFLARLPRRERAIAMAVLLVAAGLEGLPFADDLDDLIDTIAQRLFGKAFSAKRAKVELLSEVLGRDGAEWVLRGASALPGFPVDLAGRMSLGNMIPGTGLLRTDGSRDKSSEVLEALGPAGGVLRDAIGEGSLVERFAPVAMRNAAKAVEMNRTGEYRDKLGRKVADVDTADAAAKGLGFQPREIARESRDSRMAQSVVAQTRAAESEIVRLWAQGIVDGEPDKVTQAQEKLAAWNERNPDARIAINRVQIARMARDMRATREDRVIRAAPKELRGRVAEELR